MDWDRWKHNNSSALNDHQLQMSQIFIYTFVRSLNDVTLRSIKSCPVHIC